MKEIIWNWTSAIIVSHPWWAGAILGASLLIGVGWHVRRSRLKRKGLLQFAKLGADPRQDHSLRDPAADKLDRGPFVSSLKRALVRTTSDEHGKVVSAQATGFVIGLTGAWGLGKSSILNMLHKELSETPHVAVAMLNPWLFKDRDELVKAYFNSLGQVLGKNPDERVRAILGALEKYKATIDWIGKSSARLIDSYGALAGLANGAWSLASRVLAFVKRPEPPSLEDERKSLEEKIGLANVAIVILIDELDRIEDSEVRAVAQLIKAVGEIRGISYLVAYDPTRVADALGRGDKNDRRISGYQYLEKIIQLPIPVRPLFAEDVEVLLQSALHDFGIALPPAPDDNQKSIFAYLKSSINTAREVKRLVGAFSVFEETSRGEVSPYDVLAYSWLITKAPGVKEALIANLERVVSDPSDEDEILARAAGSLDKPSVESILGTEAVSFAPLLKLLFSSFGEDRQYSEVMDRISQRRNLIRLVYMGDPPGAIRRRDIERVWGMSDFAAVKTELQRMQDRGSLSQFLDRLDDLLPAMPESGDQKFWPALSQHLYGKHDWITSVDNRRVFADDAGSSLFRLGIRNKAQLHRARRNFEILRTQGDLIFVPWMLRKHLFAFGLTHHGPAQGGETLLNREETEQLLDTETPRYREAVFSGEALRRLPTVEAIYVLANSRRWTRDLRDSLTSQLNGIAAISTFAALLVPPGYVADREHLNDMFDIEQVSLNLQQSVNDEGWPQDKWVEESLRRLQRIISIDGADLDEDTGRRLPIGKMAEDNHGGGAK